MEQLLQLPDPIVVSSFMRSGTHLALDFLRWNFPGVGASKLPLEANDNVYLPIDCLIDGTWSERRVHKVLQRSGVPLCKTHWCDPEFARVVNSRHRAIGLWLQRRARVILVQRDPRKTLESLVVWQYFHGNLAEPAIPSGDWLRVRLAELRTRLRAWSNTSRPVYKLSTDRLIDAPDLEGTELSRFLGKSPLSTGYSLPGKLKGKWHSRRNRLFSTRPVSTEILTLRPAPEVRWTEEQVDTLHRELGKLAETIPPDLQGPD